MPQSKRSTGGSGATAAVPPASATMARSNRAAAPPAVFSSASMSDRRSVTAESGTPRCAGSKVSVSTVAGSSCVSTRAARPIACASDR